ncbi:hypothetical protein OHB26_06065 [Nocardia sp. NBC_01503]|uniref:hypothetical protein n=1 Tax=Nocardia sp. NBC_01503 TaxID=2975997 RepID=UPI002E7B3F6E|nr:hypothetical protein [Nocardia sp. NBC_01503]WTL33784.1 hypothetical protein OHB26_06065 [Nocardia sp. NBC_01503]
MSNSQRRDKAVIYVNRGVLTSKADLDWATFYARQRAQELNLRVAEILVLGNSDAAHMESLYNAVRRVDSACVITPDLGHVGGNSDRVTVFAELHTVAPAKRYPWRLGLSSTELADALNPPQSRTGGFPPLQASKTAEAQRDR